ncbi:hypothetical protein BDL97_03G090200 [Sphagnum fallax]|nr:hypothetical protein BDL97_03G090200 [Sphagnum fallax]
MGRKQRQVCFGLRLLVLLAVLIVIAPPWFFSIDTYFALMRFVRKGLSFKEDEGADIVFTNATIWTGDSIQPWAEFMVLRKGRILRVGNLTQLQYMRIGSKMEVVDLEGKFVTPGFIDSHLHFLHGGLQMKHVDLGCVNSRAEFERKFRIAAEDVESGKWIFGSMWNEENWGGTLPEASWIDNVTPHHPVWACRIDVHTCLANSMAMALANISRDTVDPEGGTVVKNILGDPTGLFKDMASRLITHHIPPMSVEERREALIRASELALSRGVTSVVDFGRVGASEHPWDDFREVYLWADAAGRMQVRVSIFLPIETWQSVMALVRQRGFMLSQWLHIGGVKAFADGSLGTRTALFHKAYADDNSNYGLLALDLDWFQEAVLGADNAGLQVAVHAIGDAANDHVLSTFETVVSKNGPRDRRFRIEHAQHLSAGAPERFQASGVVASVQPWCSQSICWMMQTQQ